MDKKIKHAVFRETLLKKALEKKENGGKITSILDSLAQKTHYHPIKGEITISVSTLFRLMRKYLSEGIDGLITSGRNDKGKPRKISDETIEKAISLRKDNPYRTTRVLLKILEDEYGITGVCESTLNYHLDLHEYSRRYLKTFDTKVHIRFENKAPNDLWIGDYHDKSGLFPLATGKFAYLSAFIDCHSRYIVHGQYYLKENIMSLEDSFKKAILKWGIPKRVFVDNAQIYRSHRFAYACSKMGINLIFSKPYIKESRGKIEKFFRYVKENFESEALHRGGFETIDQLNEFFWSWLELDYHQKEHASTEQTPDKRFKKDFERKNADISIVHELFMLEENRTVDKKTATVSVMGIKFQCEGFLSSRRVQVHYNPNDLSYVIIYYKNKQIHRAYPQQINKRLPTVQVEPQESLKYDYLAALDGKYQDLLGKNLFSLELSTKNEQTSDEKYDYLSFQKDVEEKLHIKLSKQQEQTCKNFYQLYHPLERKVVIQGISYAKNCLQEDHDLGLYLDYIKLFVLNQKSK